MALFETQRSTKTLVILTRPEEWSLWRFQHKDKAVAHSVWEYCGPAVPTPPALSPKPERPTLVEGDLTAEVLQVQRMKLSEWDGSTRSGTTRTRLLRRSAPTWP
jgi:hypothetical protein